MLIACFEGSVLCLRALAAGGPGGKLEGDAAVNAVDHNGDTALDHALEQNFAEVTAILRNELGGKRAADLS